MSMIGHNKILGETGEKIASFHLQNLGYKIIETNFKINRFSEIDLIALNKSKILTFIEVKTRLNKNNNFRYSGFESITAKKLNSIKLGIAIYLSKNNLNLDTQIQFDIIIIQIMNFDKYHKIDNIDLLAKNANINHIENFELF